MIPIEKLRKVTVVYTHAHCPDGLASAMILKDAFRMLGTAPRIEFLAHGTEEHKNAVSDEGETAGYALFCDIAPHHSVFNGIEAGVAQPVIVLDHHVGAKDIVESFGENGIYADAEKEPGVSGVVLAWREVWEPIELSNRQTFKVPIVVGAPRQVYDFADCVGVRDTWQTQDPNFQRGQWISKMLMSKPASYWLTQLFSGGTHVPYLNEQEIEMGRALFEAHEEAVRQAVEQCVVYDMPNDVGLYVFQEQACGFRLTSDLAEVIRSDEQSVEAIRTGVGRGLQAVVAGFSYVVDKVGDLPRLVYSLRGLNGFDVQKFATANGGGGHRAAAGFAVPEREVFPGPYEYIRQRLEGHLGKKENR